MLMLIWGVGLKKIFWYLKVFDIIWLFSVFSTQVRKLILFYFYDFFESIKRWTKENIFRLNSHLQTKMLYLPIICLNYDVIYYLPIGCRFRTDPDSREVLFKEIPDESRFSGWVLSDKHDHRLRVEVRVVKSRRVEIVKSISEIKKKKIITIN